MVLTFSQCSVMNTCTNLGNLQLITRLACKAYQIIIIFHSRCLPFLGTSKPPPAPTQTTTGSSVMDDLLDLDLLDTGPIDSTPVPIPTPITPNSSVPMPSAGTATNTSAPVKTGLSKSTCFFTYVHSCYSKSLDK